MSLAASIPRTASALPDASAAGEAPSGSPAQARRSSACLTSTGAARSRPGRRHRLRRAGRSACWRRREGAAPIRPASAAARRRPSRRHQRAARSSSPAPAARAAAEGRRSLRVRPRRRGGLALARAGVPFRILPGVTSAVSPALAAAASRRPRAASTSRDPRRRPRAGSADDLDWAALATHRPADRPLHGAAATAEIAAALIAGGLAAATPAAVIASATTSRTSASSPTSAASPPAPPRRRLAPSIVVVGESCAARSAPWRSPDGDGAMTARGLIVAAPRSGSGKTTVTHRPDARAERRGLAVRGAKRSRLHRPGVPRRGDRRARASTSTAGRCRRRCSTRSPPSSGEGADARRRRRHGPVRRHRASPGAPAPPPTSPRASAGRSCSCSTSRARRSPRPPSPAAAPATTRVAHAGVVLNAGRRASATAGSSEAASRDRPAGHRRAAPRRTMRCPSAISASCRRASTPISTRLERLADVMRARSILDALRRSPRRCRRTPAATPPPCRRRASASRSPGRRLLLRLSARRCGLAAAGAEIVPFSPLADEPPDPMRRVLAAGRLSGAACRRASRRRGRFQDGLPASPPRGRCMASAAATWCLSAVTLIVTTCSACSATSPAARGGG